MNSISGHISNIQSEGSFQLIEIKAGKDSFKSIIIRNELENYVNEDHVMLHFKENEVSIALRKLEEISLQNQIEGRIKELQKDQLLCRVVIQTEHGLISSVITAASANRLRLELDRKVVAMIKTNEIMLSKL